MFVDRHKFWNDRYEKLDKKPTIDGFLSSNSHLFPAVGRALDLACGLGGNGIYLAKNHLQVDAWDFSESAILQLQAEANMQGVTISAQVRDILAGEWPVAEYDLITVSRFLERSLVSSIIQALKPGGLLFYQTFVKLQVDGKGPENPRFRLEKNELLNLFVPALELVLYKEEWDIGGLNSPHRDSAFLVARRSESRF